MWSPADGSGFLRTARRKYATAGQDRASPNRPQAAACGLSGPRWGRCRRCAFSSHISECPILIPQTLVENRQQIGRDFNVG